MDPPTWTGMFPMREFKLSECGTHMIHRENGWTIMDCRTEQRQRWEKIRHAERMKGEKREREETVDRWRERKCMKRGGPSGVAGTHQGRDDEHPQDGHGLLPARLARLLRPLARLLRPLARFECTLSVMRLVCGSPSTDTGAGGALSSRTGMAQYSQHHLRRRGGHIHGPTQGTTGLAGQWQPVGTTQHEA